MLKSLNDPDYKRGMQSILSQLNRQECKTLLIARYKMLECGQNFKGSRSEICSLCNVIDDENHVLNHCKKYESIRESPSDITFEDVHSDQIEKIRNVINSIEKIWNTTNAHGTLR